MSLNGIDSSNGYLEAITTDGSAVSVQVVQEPKQGDFTRVSSPVVNFELANISTSSPPPNTIFYPSLVSNDDGDRGAASKDGGAWAWRGWDNSNPNMYFGTVAVVNGVTDDWVQFRYDAGIILTSYRFYTVQDIYIPKSFTWSGSLNGTDWDVLHTATNQTVNQYSYSPTYVFTNTVAYKYYRFTATEMKTNNNTLRIGEFNQWGPIGGDIDVLTTDEPIIDGDNLVLIKDDNTIHEFVASGVTGSGPYSMDTTVITAGEVPSKVYLPRSEILFNNVVSNEISNVYSGAGPLLSTKTLASVPISGRTLETTVNLSAIGNKMTELAADIFFTGETLPEITDIAELSNLGCEFDGV